MVKVHIEEIPNPEKALVSTHPPPPAQKKNCRRLQRRKELIWGLKNYNSETQIQVTLKEYSKEGKESEAYKDKKPQGCYKLPGENCDWL